MELLNVIKYDGPADASPWLVYKCPFDNYVFGSQLIVNQSQEAIFFKGGIACDVFGPGTHTLSSKNIPILGKLINLPFGGKTPFASEIYFVNRASKLDLNWGTSTPIPLLDPKYQIMINARSFGHYGVRIRESRHFVTQLIGAVTAEQLSQHQKTLEFFRGQIIAKVKETIAKYALIQKISFLEISAYLSEIAAQCNLDLADQFENYGLELASFTIMSIDVPKEDSEHLQRVMNRAMEVNILGDQRVKMFNNMDVLEKMAEHPNLIISPIGRDLGISHFASDLQPMAQASSSLPNTVSCMHCNQSNPQDAKFCAHCGKPNGPSFCRNCGTSAVHGSKFCGNCGNSLLT